MRDAWMWRREEPRRSESIAQAVRPQERQEGFQVLSLDPNLIHEPEEWWAFPYGSFGNISALYCQPKAGKTWFVMHLLRAMVNRTDGYLGIEWSKKIDDVCVLYLTEEPKERFNRMAVRFGLGDRVRYVPYNTVAKDSREQTIRNVSQFIADQPTHQRWLVVIDTAERWLKTYGMSDNAIKIFEAFEDLATLTLLGTAVLIIAHSPRQGNWMKGRNEWEASVDRLIGFSRVSEDKRDPRRRLEFLGRYWSEDGDLSLLEDTTIEWMGGPSLDISSTYEVIARGDASSARDKYADVRNMLEASGEVTIADLMGTGMAETTARRLLKEMDAQGIVAREQRKNDSGHSVWVYRYAD
ncbi:MAG: AAA family ATPase [Actinomycetota bacterium]